MLNDSKGNKYKVNTGGSKLDGDASVEQLFLHIPRGLKPDRIKSYEKEHTLYGHKKAVYCCAFEPRLGFYIATCSHDMTCVVWDIRNGSRVRTLKEHAGWIMHLAWTPDGNYLLTASADKTIKLWTVHKTFVWGDFECIHTFLGHNLDHQQEA